MLLVLNLPLIPYIAKLLLVPRNYLIPVIMFFSLMGVDLVSFNIFDIQMIVFIAVIAVVLRLLGFILGGMLEDNLRRAISVSDGQLSFLWERPTMLTTMILVALAILVPVLAACMPTNSVRLVLAMSTQYGSRI
jgi:putative tricarboxylic transport membrane protein